MTYKSTQEYSRGQIEAAVKAVVQPDLSGSIFKTRMKRLLEIDIRDAKENNCDSAFVSQNDDGKGVNRIFTAFDGFMIALAHELLGSGFKQSEVVFIMQHSRSYLLQAFDRIKGYPDAFRQNVAVSDYPNIPERIDKPDLCDMRVFLLFQKFDQPRGSKQPLISAPSICFGMKAFSQKIDDESYSSMTLTVVEIAKIVINLIRVLQKTPTVSRGPKLKKKGKLYDQETQKI